VLGFFAVQEGLRTEKKNDTEWWVGYKHMGGIHVTTSYYN